MHREKNFKIQLIVLCFFVLSLSNTSLFAVDWAAWKAQISEMASSAKSEISTKIDESGWVKTDIVICSGSEKKKMYNTAIESFKKTKDGKGVKVKMIYSGSISLANEIINGNPKGCHVFSPASQIAVSMIEEEKDDAIVETQNVAYMPMVVVIGKRFYQALATALGTEELTLKDILENSGREWKDIDPAKKDWGTFWVEMTNARKSNSGLMGLIAVSHEYHDKSRLTPGDLRNAEFTGWLGGLKDKVGMDKKSTGKLTKSFASQGEYFANAIITYESLAIQNWKGFTNKGLEPILVYPSKNIMNNNPYAILSSSDEKQKKGAKKFLNHVISAEVQNKVLTESFMRPANPDVDMTSGTSPFITMGETLKTRVPGVLRGVSGAVATRVSDVAFPQ